MAEFVLVLVPVVVALFMLWTWEPLRRRRLRAAETTVDEPAELDRAARLACRLQAHWANQRQGSDLPPVLLAAAVALGRRDLELADRLLGLFERIRR